MPTLYRSLLFVFLLLLVSSPCLAQNNRERKNMRVEGGTIKAMQGQILQVADSEGAQYYVKVPARADSIKLQGSATPEWLGRGMTVRFVAKFDKKGKAVSEVSQIEVFTPTREDKPGVFPDSGLGAGSGELFSNKPKNPDEAEASSMKVVGQVVGARKGSLYVRAANATVQVKMSDRAKVSVAIADLRLMRPGDKVSFNGWYYPEQPQQIYANSVTVTAANPIGSTPEKKSVRRRTSTQQE